MPKFRKKPVVIEAQQFMGLDSYLDIVSWMKASGDTLALANDERRWRNWRLWRNYHRQQWTGYIRRALCFCWMRSIRYWRRGHLLEQMTTQVMAGRSWRLR